MEKREGEREREGARLLAEQYAVNEFVSGYIICPFNLINKHTEAMRGRGECSVSVPTAPPLLFQPQPHFTN